MPYLLVLKKRQNLKLSSAVNYRWRFMVTNRDVNVFFQVLGLYLPAEEMEHVYLIVHLVKKKGDV